MKFRRRLKTIGLYPILVCLLVFNSQVTLSATYKMEYGLETNTSKTWIPLPTIWGTPDSTRVEINSIAPTPTDLYYDGNGIYIAYWENPAQTVQRYIISFEIDLEVVDHQIDDWMKRNLPDGETWPAYDTDSPIYQVHTSPTENWVQSDSPEITQASQGIVGSLVSPFEKAKAIYSWIGQNLSFGSGPRDAISVLNSLTSDCAGYASLFVGLCRAQGIPARYIGGMHPLPTGGEIFKDGTYWWAGPDGSGGSISLGYHVWAELYLPIYGWVQVDPTTAAWQRFGNLSYHRIVTSKGSTTNAGYGDTSNTPWFHLPRSPGTQQEDKPLWLTVHRLDDDAPKNGSSGVGLE